MTYVEFREEIRARLRKTSSGMTWRELRAALDLPYERPCPEWVRQLEAEIGLIRRKGSAKALVWQLKNK